MNDLLENHNRQGAVRAVGRGRGMVLGAYGFAFFAYWAVYTAAIEIASDYTLGKAALSALIGILPDCLLAPPALAFSRRIAWGRVAPWRFLLLHILGAVAFISLSSSGFALEFAIERRLETGAWAFPAGIALVAWKGFGSLFVYATVCGIGNTIEQARRAAAAEVLRAEAQLGALRARLNPHFILNLLHTLMGLVAREPATAEAALERLGDVLRYALRVQSQGLDEVRLREEWDFVEQYLSLERLRLGARLRVRLEAEANLLDAIVPAFSLQPLVENAVRHAIAPRAEGGTLLVSARREGRALRLSVEDDGAWRDPSAPPATRSAPPGEGHPDRRSGLGLRLIRERLQVLYGDEARLETGPSALGGFRASVTVPLTSAPEPAS